MNLFYCYMKMHAHQVNIRSLWSSTNRQSVLGGGLIGGEGVLIFWCYRKQHVQAAAFNIVSEMVVTIKFLLNILFFAVFYLHNTLQIHGLVFQVIRKYFYIPSRNFLLLIHFLITIIIFQSTQGFRQSKLLTWAYFQIMSVCVYIL